jgi:hypothetical protein
MLATLKFTKQEVEQMIAEYLNKQYRVEKVSIKVKTQHEERSEYFYPVFDTAEVIIEMP